MVDSVTGLHGVNALAHVVEAIARELVLVQIQLLVMVDDHVLVHLLKSRTVIRNVVQVGKSMNEQTNYK